MSISNNNNEENNFNVRSNCDLNVNCNLVLNSEHQSHTSCIPESPVIYESDLQQAGTKIQRAEFKYSEIKENYQKYEKESNETIAELEKLEKLKVTELTKLNQLRQEIEQNIANLEIKKAENERIKQLLRNKNKEIKETKSQIDGTRSQIANERNDLLNRLNMIKPISNLRLEIPEDLPEHEFFIENNQEN